MGCATSAPTVQQEQAPGYDVAGAKTYAWITEDLVLINFGENQPTIRTQDNEKLIREAIDRELAAQGRTKVASEEAQVFVAFSVGVRTRYALEGGPGTAVAMDGPGQSQVEGTLNIYLMDQQTNQEVWHGWASKTLNKGDDPKTVIDEAVSLIVATLPAG